MAFSVSYIYEIVDRYSGPLRKITNQTRKFQKSAKGASARLSGFSKKMMSAQTAVSTFVGVLGGANVFNTFIGFEKSMNKLGSVTLASDKIMDKFRKTAKHLGATTQFSASQAAQGMTFLAMAGLSTDQILKAIPQTLKLAAASGLDMASAADIATNVMAQMGFSAKDLARINDVLALSQSKANLNVMELFEAMRPAAVTAKNLGFTLEQTASVMGVMANAGEKGSIAGTLFRNMLTNLAGPSGKQAKLYKLLGINLRAFVDKTGKITNFSGFISKMQDLTKAGRLSVPVLQALFGERGFRAAQILIGAGGKALERFNKLLAGASGTADKASKAMMRGLPGVMLAMASAFEALKIALFESGLDKILIKIFTKVTDVLRTFSAANPKILIAVGILGVIAVAAGPVIIAMGMIAGGLGAVAATFAFLISGPVVAIAAIAAGIVLVVGYLHKAWGASEKFRAGVGHFVAAFAPLKKVALVVLRPVLDLFTSIKNTIMEIIDALPSIKSVGDTIGGAFDFAAQGVEFVTSGITDLFGTEPASNSGALNGAINGRIEVSASGGAQVKHTSMETNLPGNMGMTLAASHR